MNTRRATAVVLAAACGAALTMLSALGFFVRYRADDFRTASVLVHLGFWRSQSWWYQNWSGRFAFTFVIGALEKAGPAIVPLLAGITIAAWVVATFELLRRLRVPHALALALTFVFAAADTGPDVSQSILWQTGIVTYVVPVAGLTAWLATTVRRSSVRWYDILLPFVLGGFSEANTLTQIVLAAALAVVFAGQRRIFSVSLASSIAALAVVAAAPGNRVRMAAGAGQSLTWIARDALSQTLDFFRYELVHGGWTLLLVFIAAALLATRPAARLLIAAAATAAGSAVATELAIAAALRTPPSPRTLTAAHAALIAAVAIAGAMLPLSARATMIAAAAAAALVVFGPAEAAIDHARDLAPASRFARAWDRLDGELRQCRGCEVVVAGVPGNPGTVLFITHDREDWPNRCISYYYSLSGIAADPPGTSMAGKLLEDLPVYAPESARRHDHDHVVRLRFASD